MFHAILEYASNRLECDNYAIKVDREKLHNLRFADDIILISDNLGEANEMIEQLQMVALFIPSVLYK